MVRIVQDGGALNELEATLVAMEDLCDMGHTEHPVFQANVFYAKEQIEKVKDYIEVLRKGHPEYVKECPPCNDGEDSHHWITKTKSAIVLQSEKGFTTSDCMKCSAQRVGSWGAVRYRK